MVYIFVPLLLFIILIGGNIAYFIGYFQSVTSLKKNQRDSTQSMGLSNFN